MYQQPNSRYAALPEMIRNASFPCVGAKASLARNELKIYAHGDLRFPHNDETHIRWLQATVQAAEKTGTFTSVVVIYPETPQLSEEEFETAMWQRLQALHDLDRLNYGWDPQVSSDPEDRHFGYSIAGSACFVIGLHPGSSRLARRSSAAMIVFNLHSQFQRLKATGQYQLMARSIRERDVALQGCINPMLSDHGDVSEALQYSGRSHTGPWTCPLKVSAPIAYAA